jgi:hypothetical protein
VSERERLATIGLTISAALYVAMVFAAGLCFRKMEVVECAIATAGLQCLSYFCQSRADCNYGFALILVAFTWLFGIGAGFSLLG